jgi:transposase
MKDWAILDAPMWGRHPVLIRLLVPSLECPKCGPSLVAPPEWLISPRRSTRTERSNRRIYRTKRLNEYVLERLSDVVTFDQVSRETLLNQRTIKSIFFTEFDQLDRDRRMDLPVHMGIDEAWYLVKRKRRYVTLIVDHDIPGGVVDILPSRRTSEIVKRFYSASNREDVSILTMDMLEQFYDAAKRPHTLNPNKKGLSKDAQEEAKQLALDFAEGDMARFLETDSGKSQTLPGALPNAQIIVDLFHISQVIVNAFTRARRAVQKRIDRQVNADPEGALGPDALALMKEELGKAGSSRARRKLSKPAAWLKSKRFELARKKGKNDDQQRFIVDIFLAQDSLLKAAWELKEEGVAIFVESRSPDEAKTKTRKWVEKVEASEARAYFQPVVRTINTWKDALFMIAGSDYDNSRTEAKVGFMKLRRALGRGMSFRTIRALMIWGDARRRRTLWPEQFKTDKQRTLDRLLQWIDEDEKRLVFKYPECQKPLPGADSQLECPEETDSGEI